MKCMQKVSAMSRAIALAGFAAVLAAQTPPAAPAERAPANFTRVIGEVTAIDPGARQITLKTDTGASATISLDEKTLYLRVPPGEKDLKKAAKINLPDISAGDRVLARFKVSPGEPSAAPSTAAVSVMVMTKAELAQKHERDRAEWLKRSVVGTISGLNPDTKEITVAVRSRMEGPHTMVVESADTARYRRYAPDSVRFSDAKPSSFAELKIGDNIRVLGEKNADGTRVKPEEIVSGSFRNVAGVVTSVNAAAGEVAIKDLQNNKPLTVRVNSESMLRRMPEMMAMMIARRRQAAAGDAAPGSAAAAGGPATPAAGGPEGPAPAGARGAAESGPGVRQRIPGSGPRGPGGPEGNASWRGGANAPGGMGGMGGDLQQMFERMPAITLSELKPGDAIIISSTTGSDTSKLTAITLVAGVEPLFTAARAAGQSPVGGMWNFGDIGLPQ